MHEIGNKAMSQIAIISQDACVASVSKGCVATLYFPPELDSPNREANDVSEGMDPSAEVLESIFMHSSMRLRSCCVSFNMVAITGESRRRSLLEFVAMKRNTQFFLQSKTRF